MKLFSNNFYIRKCFRVQGIKHKTELSATSISYILKKISDDKALTLFNNIALAKDNKPYPAKGNEPEYEAILFTDFRHSAGLIKKKQGQYCLTALGKVVYNAHTVMGKALSYYWKMKAIESIQSSAGREVAREDMLMLIQSLIDNHQVRVRLLKSIPSVEAPEMRR